MASLTSPPLPSSLLPCSSQCSIQTARVKHAHTDRVTDTDKQRLYVSIVLQLQQCSSFRITSPLLLLRLECEGEGRQLSSDYLVSCDVVRGERTGSRVCGAFISTVLYSTTNDSTLQYSNAFIVKENSG